MKSDALFFNSSSYNHSRENNKRNYKIYNKGNKSKENFLISPKYVILIIGIVSLIAVLSSTINAFANSNEMSYSKYYTSIQIQENDTLWDLADEYIGSYSVAKEEYIDEVCKLNNLTDGNIHTGEYIVMPYYSQDAK